MSLSQIFRLTAERNSSNPAVAIPNGVLSYGEFLSLVDSDGGGDAQEPLGQLVGLFRSLEHQSICWTSGAIADRACLRRGLAEHEVSANGVVLATSGTSGLPRLVHLPADSLAWTVWNTIWAGAQAQGVPLDPPDSTGGVYDALERACADRLGLVMGSCLPLTSVAGLSVALRALLAGEALCLGLSPDPRRTIEVLTLHGVNVFGTSPILAQRLIRHEPPRTSLWSVGLGGSSVPSDLIDRVEAWAGCVVTSGYGATELGGVVAMTLASDSRQDRVDNRYKIAPSARVRVGEPDRAGVGRLYVSSRSTCSGYVADGRFTRVDTVDTGDLGCVAADGRLVLHGRADNTILRGARRLDPSIIEAQVNSVPGVLGCTVHGAPSRIDGETDVIARVALAAGVELRDVWSAVREAARDVSRVVQVDPFELTVDGSAVRHRMSR